MTENYSPDPDSSELTPKQEKLIAALLAGNTMLASAKIAGCSEKTAYLWLKLPGVSAAYLAAKRAVFDDSLERLQLEIADAINTLKTIMKNDESSDAARVRAAQIILEQAIEQHQSKQFEERLTELESQAAQRNATK